MKKKTYVWLASLLLMLVATLTSCEKFALDDSGTNSHDANANVIIHASVAKNNSTGTRSGEEDEAADIEGCTKWESLWKITVPGFPSPFLMERKR